MVHRSRRRTTSHNRDRLWVIQAVVVAFAGILVLRLFTLQVLRHNAYAAIAENQYNLAAKLEPTRGDIYVRDHANSKVLFPLATNREEPNAIAVPDSITDAPATAAAIAPILGIPADQILPKLQKPHDQYEVLQRRISADQQHAIEALHLAGIRIEMQSWRFYPESTFASHVVGFVGYSGDERKGLYGVEGAMDDALAGKEGSISNLSAAREYLPLSGNLITEATNGGNVVLTLDHTVQFQACTLLRDAVEKHGAAGGALTVMEVQTGRILAVCGQPDFDPNNYSQTENASAFNNPVVFGAYEPGSVFKAITMAAALDQGKVTPQTTYENTGSIKIGPYTIKNSDPQPTGITTMTKVLEQSYNTGAIFAAEQVGLATFSRYVSNFGFGHKTGVELTGEVVGNTSSLTKAGDIYLATGSFGQGITTTPIQLLAAFGAIANGGKLMRPYVVDEVDYPDGRVVKTQPQVVRQVIRADTAATLSAMLVNVVENGHGKRAGVKGYYVAGKTGTAQVRATNGSGYDPHKTIGSFAGFAPVENPQFVMLARIDEPKDVQFAESSAAPLFGSLMDFLLKYYDVAPTRTTQ